MANGKNKNYVSFWFWMLALFVTALPCVGFIMVIVWAFVGDNESRKNYFRAVIAWFLIVAALSICVMGLGFWPVIQKQMQLFLDHAR
jgi:uncharacterized membrane protein YqjE